MNRKSAVSLALLTLMIGLSVLLIMSGSVTHPVYAQSAATSTPGVITVRNGGPQAAAISAISLENDSIRRLFSCKLSPGSSAEGWAFSAQGQLASLYSGARLTVDPGSIAFVEAQPTLCTGSSQTQYQGFAIAPDGKYYPPTVFTARGSTDKTSRLVSLPLRAYMQPGIWRLGVNDPNYFEVLIEVTRPSGPFFLSDVTNTGLLGGFSPNEPIKGILFSRGDNINNKLAYAADFDTTADANGYAVVALSGLTTERLEDNYLLFAGRDRHYAMSNLLATALKLNGTNVADLENTIYTEYWIKPFIQPTSTPLPPVIVIPANPIANRDVPPPNSVRLGEFQVEQYCNSRGYGVTLINNENDWACTNQPNGSVAFQLGPNDFDAICQQKYAMPSAFAIRDQRKPTQAYNWSCYVQSGLIPPPDRRDVPPVNSVRLGEFTVEQYCNDRGYGVTLTNNDADWACTNKSNNTTAFILGATDFDAICQQTYNRSNAFAIRDQRKATQAYNWSCYAYR